MPVDFVDHQLITYVVFRPNHLTNTEDSTTPKTNSLTSNTLRVDQFIYSDSNGTVWAEHYKIFNGGHVWFDLDLNGSNTNQLLWDFFKKHELNGPR